MDLNERPRGFGSDSPTGSDLARGLPQLYCKYEKKRNIRLDISIRWNSTYKFYKILQNIKK